MALIPTKNFIYNPTPGQLVPDNTARLLGLDLPLLQKRNIEEAQGVKVSADSKSTGQIPNDNTLSGFYYDIQLDNPFTMCSLHPNRIFKVDENNKKGVWVSVPADEQDEDDKENDNVKEKYRKKPLCQSIFNEDFNVSIANNWSDFGGDPIGEMWNNLKPLAPYAAQLVSSLNTMMEQQKDVDRKHPEVNSSYTARALKYIVRQMSKVTSKDANGNTLNDRKDPASVTNSAVVDYLNRSLVVQGTRFSYYSGTGVSFGNLSMKFTVFPKWDKDGKFITVNSQINELYPYLIGRYVPAEPDMEDKDSAAFIKDFIGWQMPPGGFASDMKNVDNVQCGTLKLKLGAYYYLNNLVCNDATFNFSKQMVKNPQSFIIGGNLQEDMFSPLYCDVTLTLRPATKYSDQKLREFATGQGRAIHEHKTIKENMMKRLKNRQSKLMESGLVRK